MSSNTEVMDTIRRHHSHLAEDLETHTERLLAAVRAGGDGANERDALHDWFRTELVPHALAEERALYNRGADLPETRLLVDGMLAEHRFIVERVDELSRQSEGMAAAGTAVAAQAVFTVHLAKENDLLLPALDRAGVDLAQALAGMHELLGGHG